MSGNLPPIIDSTIIPENYHDSKLYDLINLSIVSMINLIIQILVKNHGLQMTLILVVHLVKVNLEVSIWHAKKGVIIKPLLQSK